MSSSSSSSLPATYSVYRRTGKITGNLDDWIELKSVPLPQPQHGQVLIRVRAVSLNYRDLLIAKGKYPGGASANGIPLSDGAGDIVALGDGVTQWKIGTRVSASFTPSSIGGSQRHGWIPLSLSLGGDIDGVLAEYVVAEASGIVDIGDKLSYEEAASLPCAGVTAYNALYNGVQPLRAGRTVLVLGTGGVSVLAAQLALAAGARVIATSSSDDKLKKLEKLGVKSEDLINYKKNPEWSKKVRELTGGLGVDHVIEVGGPGTIEQSVRSTRVSGEVAVIGLVGGVEGSINPLEILMGGLNVRGVLVGSRENFQDLLAAINHSNIKPVVDEKKFTFDKATEALKYLESGEHFGKVVITI